MRAMTPPPQPNKKIAVNATIPFAWMEMKRLPADARLTGVKEIHK
jgi:hypothetical protein